MKMNKEEYEKLLVRFATELAEVGVTSNLLQQVKDVLERQPNCAGIQKEETIANFQYRHNGYLIQAKKTVEIIVKKCK